MRKSIKQGTFSLELSKLHHQFKKTLQLKKTDARLKQYHLRTLSKELKAIKPSLFKSLSHEFNISKLKWRILNSALQQQLGKYDNAYQGLSDICESELLNKDHLTRLSAMQKIKLKGFFDLLFKTLQELCFNDSHIDDALVLQIQQAQSIPVYKTMHRQLTTALDIKFRNLPPCDQASRYYHRKLASFDRKINDGRSIYALEILKKQIDMLSQMQSICEAGALILEPSHEVFKAISVKLNIELSKHYHARAKTYFAFNQIKEARDDLNHAENLRQWHDKIDNTREKLNGTVHHDTMPALPYLVTYPYGRFVSRLFYAMNHHIADTLHIARGEKKSHGVLALQIFSQLSKLLPKITSELKKGEGEFNPADGLSGLFKVLAEHKSMLDMIKGSNLKENIAMLNKENTQLSNQIVGIVNALMRMADNFRYAINDNVAKDSEVLAEWVARVIHRSLKHTPITYEPRSHHKQMLHRLFLAVLNDTKTLSPMKRITLNNGRKISARSFFQRTPFKNFDGTIKFTRGNKICNHMKDMPSQALYAGADLIRILKTPGSHYSSKDIEEGKSGTKQKLTI